MQFSKENSCSYLYVNNIWAKYSWLRSVEITGHLEYISELRSVEITGHLEYISELRSVEITGGLEYISEQKWNNWSQSLSVFYCLSAKKE